MQAAATQHVVYIAVVTFGLVEVLKPSPTEWEVQAPGNAWENCRPKCFYVSQVPTAIRIRKCRDKVPWGSEGPFPKLMEAPKLWIAGNEKCREGVPHTAGGPLPYILGGIEKCRAGVPQTSGGPPPYILGACDVV